MLIIEFDQTYYNLKMLRDFLLWPEKLILADKWAVMDTRCEKYAIDYMKSRLHGKFLIRTKNEKVTK